MNTRKPTPSVSRIRLTKPQLNVMSELVMRSYRESELRVILGSSSLRVLSRLRERGLVEVREAAGMESNHGALYGITREGVALMIGRSQ